jgi:hypothetical protein
LSRQNPSTRRAVLEHCSNVVKRQFVTPPTIPSLKIAHHDEFWALAGEPIPMMPTKMIPNTNDRSRTTPPKLSGPRTTETDQGYFIPAFAMRRDD